METDSVKVFDKYGMEHIFGLLEGVTEDAQSVQNLLLATCTLAQNIGLEYTSFIELVAKDWGMADQLLKKIEEQQ